MVRAFRAPNQSWYGVALYYHYPQGLTVRVTEACYNRATAEHLARKLLLQMGHAQQQYPEGPPQGYL